MFHRRRAVLASPVGLLPSLTQVRFTTCIRCMRARVFVAVLTQGRFSHSFDAGSFQSCPSTSAMGSTGRTSHAASPVYGAGEHSTVQQWYARMMADVRQTREVLMSTYMYDHPALHALLMRRLDGSAPYRPRIIQRKHAVLSVSTPGCAPWEGRQSLSVHWCQVWWCPPQEGDRR